VGGHERAEVARVGRDRPDDVAVGLRRGTEPLITFFAFPGHAGHDYGTIEQKGFRKLCVERDGAPSFVDNPRWVD
jgi:hypothetical protein